MSLDLEVKQAFGQDWAFWLLKNPALFVPYDGYAAHPDESTLMHDAKGVGLYAYHRADGGWVLVNNAFARPEYEAPTLKMLCSLIELLK